MNTATPPARWKVIVPAVALLFGVAWAVLTRINEGRITPLATYWLYLWTMYLTAGVVTYNRERHNFLAQQPAQPAEEEPAP